MTRSLKNKLWCGAFLFLASVQLLCLVLYERDQRYLRKLMDQIVSRDAPPSKQAEAVLEFFRDKSDRNNQSYFLLPIFQSLRPTPRQIAEGGGWCSDRSRLVVALLELRGIRASKWALYSPKEVATHAVVEVDSEGGKMVVDPLFGLWFPEPAGGRFYGIEEMRDHAEILKDRLDLLIRQGVEPGSDPLTRYPVDRYTYAYARTINWEKSGTFKVMYNAFYALVGPAVDDLPRPSWSEQPALMVIYGIVPLEMLLFLLWIRTAGRKRTSVIPTPRARKAKVDRRAGLCGPWTGLTKNGGEPVRE